MHALSLCFLFYLHVSVIPISLSPLIISTQGFPSPWKTSTYLFLTPFLAAEAGLFDGGLESKSSIEDPGGFGGPPANGGRPPPGGGGVAPDAGAVTLSANDDFWRLIPPSGISVNPALEVRELGGRPPALVPPAADEPVLRDSRDGGGVADGARDEAGAAD
jgi:hypothetical protein